jgi:predicted TIM-barrel fold metal-dependent hydrolase
LIIDFHTHVGNFGRTRHEDRDPVTFENLIARLDDEGIDKAVLLPVYVSPDAIYPGFIIEPRMSVHDQVLDAARYPDRIIRFGNMDPRWAGNALGGDFSSFLDWFQEQGCLGIGEVTSNLPFDDPRVVSMFRQIGERRMPVVFHGVGFGPGTYGLQDDVGSPRLERLLQQAPDTIIVGHGPGFWAEIGGGLTPQGKMGYPTGPITEEGSLPKLLRRYPNLYCDMSAGSGYRALTRDREFGIRFLQEFQDQVLFATDVTSNSPESRTKHLAMLKGLRDEGHLTQEAFDKITGGNALRILGLA